MKPPVNNTESFHKIQHVMDSIQDLFINNLDTRNILWAQFFIFFFTQPLTINTYKLQN